ncbi:hypothetical protein ABZP36_021150 [Zizania latifolia]
MLSFFFSNFSSRSRHEQDHAEIPRKRRGGGDGSHGRGILGLQLYKPINKTYSSSLLDHGERLFAFADKDRGSYTPSFPELSAFYDSTTYQDELLLAASWLYHATGKNGEDFADLGNPRYFSWDDKRAATEVHATESDTTIDRSHCSWLVHSWNS